MKGKNESERKCPKPLLAAAAVFAALVSAFTLSGCIPMCLNSTDSPIEIEHEYIDTSPYNSAFYDEMVDDYDLIQSLFDTPTADDGIDYTDEYYERRMEGDYIYAAAWGENNIGKGYIAQYLGTEESITLPRKLGDLDILYVSAEAFMDNSTLRTVVIPDGFLSIQLRAFSGCTALEKVDIPESVTSIGPSAFEDCVSLKSIKLPEGIDIIESSAFQNCTSLKELTIPEGVRTIKDFAFKDCTAFKSMDIPDSVTQLERSVFSGCTALKKVTLGKGVTELKQSLFFGCSVLEDVELKGSITTIESSVFTECGFKSFALPDGVASVGTSAFARNKKLQKFTIPASVSSFANSALRGCPQLKQVVVSDDNPYYYAKDNVLFGASDKELIYFPLSYNGEYTIPEGVKIIGQGAFMDCAKLTAVEIPDTVTTLNGDAFRKSGLRAVELPDSVKTIGEAAFADCTQLKSVSMGDRVEDIYPSAFRGCKRLTDIGINGKNAKFVLKDKMLIDTKNDVLLYVLADFSGALVVPDGIKALGEYCCSDCSVTSLTLPQSVETIGERAFYDSQKLGEITFGGKEKTIDTAVFYGCSSLKSVVLPDSVTELGSSVFAECSSLSRIELNEGLTELKSGLFRDCTSLKELIIPNSVTQVERIAENCTALERVVLSKNLTQLGAGAFYECPALTKVYFPATLEFMTNAFNCGTLKQIFYGGSKRDWQIGLRINNPEGYAIRNVEIFYDFDRPNE